MNQLSTKQYLFHLCSTSTSPTKINRNIEANKKTAIPSSSVDVNTPPSLPAISSPCPEVHSSTLKSTPHDRHLLTPELNHRRVKSRERAGDGLHGLHVPPARRPLVRRDVGDPHPRRPAQLRLAGRRRRRQREGAEGQGVGRRRRRRLRRRRREGDRSHGVAARHRSFSHRNKKSVKLEPFRPGPLRNPPLKLFRSSSFFCKLLTSCRGLRPWFLGEIEVSALEK